MLARIVISSMILIGIIAIWRGVAHAEDCLLRVKEAGKVGWHVVHRYDSCVACNTDLWSEGNVLPKGSRLQCAPKGPIVEVRK